MASNYPTLGQVSANPGQFAGSSFDPANRVVPWVVQQRGQDAGGDGGPSDFSHPGSQPATGWQGPQSGAWSQQDFDNYWRMYGGSGVPSNVAYSTLAGMGVLQASSPLLPGYRQQPASAAQNPNRAVEQFWTPQQVFNAYLPPDVAARQGAMLATSQAGAPNATTNVPSQPTYTPPTPPNTPSGSPNVTQGGGGNPNTPHVSGGTPSNTTTPTTGGGGAGAGGNTPRGFNVDITSVIDNPPLQGPNLVRAPGGTGIPQSYSAQRNAFNALGSNFDYDAYRRGPHGNIPAWLLTQDQLAPYIR